MTVQSAAGATLGISATPPATFDKTGWNAAVFTPIGEITDLGDLPSRTYDKIEHKPVGNRRTQKKKGGYDEGATQLTVGLDTKDAGQILVKAALKSDSDYYFCETLQNGDKYYYPALVMGFKPNVGTVNNIVNAQISLEVTGTGLFEDLVP